jgi:hypothetical protein
MKISAYNTNLNRHYFADNFAKALKVIFINMYKYFENSCTELENQLFSLQEGLRICYGLRNCTYNVICRVFHSIVSKNRNEIISQ